MISEIPTFVVECDEFGCRYKSDVFEWRSEAMTDESNHIAEFHVPVFDDELTHA
jgi:hypothetical protein